MNTAERESEKMPEAHLWRGCPPLPLKAVDYDVKIVSSLAVITQKRVFRNDENIPIEASITFPVAYDAAIASVKAIHGDGTLVGVAQAKEKARKTYAKALGSGKTAVLHEELERGLHMVSVGSVEPGAEIVVETVSVAPLQIVGGKGRLRIPLFVDVIDDVSPCELSDDLVVGRDYFDAGIRVRGSDDITINGKPSADVASVKTYNVIDIEVATAAFHPVFAKTAKDGYATIAFSASKSQRSNLTATLLLDASESMRTLCSGGRSKWATMCDGLTNVLASDDIQSADSFDFWTFSSVTTFCGTAQGKAASGLARHLKMGGGDTQITAALRKVARGASNVLLVTDGLFYDPIDFKFVEKTGCRFTVVLIGEGSLEAVVAKLAAETGGQLFIVPESGDVAGTVAAALAVMRASASPAGMRTSRVEALSRTVGGLDIALSYSDTPTPNAVEHPAAAAYAAWLGVQTLDEATAAQLAEDEGIATHLSSIMLVDPQSGTLNDIAATRKTAVSTPLLDVAEQAAGASKLVSKRGLTELRSIGRLRRA